MMSDGDMLVLHRKIKQKGGVVGVGYSYKQGGRRKPV